MTEPLVLAVDQGTTNTKAVVVGPDGGVRASASVRIGIEFPRPGWAQSDAREIWDSVRVVIDECLREVQASSVVAMGISNQRESVVAWDRQSGTPIGPAVSWQCGRGAPRCAELRQAGHDDLVRARTGLTLDPMFAASKMAWLLDADARRRESVAGEICLGTIDSWLVWNLTGGRCFATDLTNASRTLLLDLDRGDWADELLGIFGVPREALPTIRPSISPFGTALLGSKEAGTVEVPVWGVAGDSHAALVGHRALRPGAAKASFGTGTSVMAPIETAVRSAALSTTIAWSRQADMQAEVVYAIEGNIYATGSALEWTATLLGLDCDIARLEQLARSCETSGGVCFVPALSGLGAPYWDPAARGLITGLTRAAGPAQLSRAAFEAVAHQVADVVDSMRQFGLAIEQLHVDGGAIRSDLLATLVADTCALPIVRCDEPNIAAVGAALLAGVGAGLWPDLESTAALGCPTTRVEPRCPETERLEDRSRWAAAVRRTVGPAS
jgi:glycerol kinase